MLANLAARVRAAVHSWVTVIGRSGGYLTVRNSRNRAVLSSHPAILVIPGELAAGWEALTKTGAQGVVRLVHQHPELAGQEFGDLLRGLCAEAQATGNDAFAEWLQNWLSAFDTYRVGVAAVVVAELTGDQVNEAVLEGMAELLAAPDWLACYPVVSGNPLLLTDQAELLCRMLLGVTRAMGDETMVTTYYGVREFLRSCRAHGLANGIASFADWTGAVPDDVAALYATANGRRSAAVHSAALADAQLLLADAEQLLSHPDAGSFPRAFVASALTLAGLALLKIAELTHDKAAADSAIERLEASLAHLPDGAPESDECLANLGSALMFRFRQTDGIADLGRAGACWASAAYQVTPFSELWDQLMASAGDSLRRFTLRTGDIGPLDRLIGLQRQDVSEARPVPAVKAGLALALGLSMYLRYEMTGATDTLTAMIDVLAGTADHVGLVPQRAPLLGWAGFGLLRLYRESGDPAGLERSVALLKAAVAAAEPESIELAVSLDQLSVALRDRYTRSGRRADLDKAVELSGQAVQCAAALSEGPAFSLINLGNALIDRYRATGNEQDLHRAIKLFERDESATHDYERYTALSSLALGLMVRYQRTGALADLDSALGYLRRALELLPEHADRFGMLTNLALGLRQRYALVGDPADLNQAVALLEQVVAEEPEHAAWHAGHLGNLALGLMERWRSPDGSPDDRDAATRAWEKAVTLTEADSELNKHLIASLAAHRAARAEDTAMGGHAYDITQAVDTLASVVEATPRGTPEWTGRIGNLAYAFRIRAQQSEAKTDIDQAVDAYRLACSSGLETAPGDALQLSRTWTAWAIERQEWREAAEASRYGLDAVRYLFRAQLGRRGKETWLRHGLELASLAAYAAAEAGDVRGAVVAAEVGRALLMSEVLDLDATNVFALAANGHEALAGRYRSAANRWKELSRHRGI